MLFGAQCRKKDECTIGLWRCVVRGEGQKCHQLQTFIAPGSVRFKRHSNKVANSEFETIFPRSQPHHHLLILLNTHIICHSKTSAGRGARLVLPSDVHSRNNNNPTEHFHQQQRRGAEEGEHKAVQLAAVHHRWEGMSKLAIQ